jgi:hypothetical protein
MLAWPEVRPPRAAAIPREFFADIRHFILHAPAVRFVLLWNPKTK